jgi:hypothetical protein
MSQRKQTRVFRWAGAAVLLLACDPSVFDLPAPQKSQQASATMRVVDSGALDMRADAAPGTQTGMSAAGTGKIGFDAGAAGDSGPDASARVQANQANQSLGAAGQAGDTAALAGATGETRHPASAGMATQAGSAGMPALQDSGMPSACPRLPTSSDESFCYDFERGLNGPDNGDTYDLWTTPELAIAEQLAAVEQPDLAQNHVLQVRPSLSTSEASAALSHSTRRFERASVAFDIWVNDALEGASADVSWLRYFPSDGDYERATVLLFRRGQAVLRNDADGTETPLAKLPRSDGQASHIDMRLDRRDPCTTEVWVDGEMAARSSASSCVTSEIGFVEFGLVMTDRASGEMRAYYDNIAFTRE